MVHKELRKHYYLEGAIMEVILSALISKNIFLLQIDFYKTERGLEDFAWWREKEVEGGSHT